MYELRQGGLYPTQEEIKASKNRLLQEIRTTEEKKQARGKIHWLSVFKYIAVAVVSICSTLGIQYLTDKNATVQYIELNMEAGPRMGHITLPDGTKVILNASTKLRFPDQFKKNIREVFLDGEAYFDVKRNEKAPFVIYTDKQKIHVLGTTFNVMDYVDDDYAITTLVSGKIKMSTVDENGDYGEPIILEPNQQVFFNRQTKQLALSAIRLDMNRTWVNKVYHFRNEPLFQITARLEKLHGVKILIQNEVLKETEFTGTFGLEQELNEVLHIINFEKQFTYKKVGDTIYIE